MKKLSKWLPFKFKRNKRREQDDQSESSSRPVRVEGQPSRAMHPMSDAMLSDRYWRNPLTLFDDMDRFFGDFAPRSFHPSVDIVDEGDHIRVTAELPGLDRDDIEVSVQEGLLMLRGEKKVEDEVDEDGCYRVERYFGRFQRAIPLPSDVETEDASAKFDRGLLTIRLPKTGDNGSTRRIPIT